MNLVRNFVNERFYSKFFFLFFIFSPLNLWAQTTGVHIAKADSFAAIFDFERALDEYKKASKADAGNCTALWKISETYINLGEEAHKKVKSQYFYTAEKWALKAEERCPDEPNGHFFAAVAAGKLALFEGGKSKVNRSREIKAKAEKTLELDPKHHGAYHVLGRWHRELANLSWFLKAAAKIIYGGVPTGASNEAAIENFKKAIEIEPDWINHHRQLGKTYLLLDEWEKARQEFGKVLELPIADHEDKWHKQESEKLLEEIKGKN